MKKIISIVYLLLAAGLTYAQNLTPSENYTYTRTYLEPVATETPGARQLQAVQYFDGLGRAKQQVAIKAAVNGKDLVIPSEYDSGGRQTRSYLPVPVHSQNGALQAVDGNSANAYYGVANAYSETLLEKSPLARVLKQAHPGADWAMGTSHTVKSGYGTNAGNEVRRLNAVTAWNAANLINDISIQFAPDDSFTAGGYYKANTLVRKITRDEDDTETQTFANASGQVLLVRKAVQDGSVSYADTYYVYDEFGNLVLVVPPKAAFSTIAELNGHLGTLCYQYRYDRYNRLAEKKVPGKTNWESIVYDKQNRPVLTQDSNQKSRQWAFVKYDWAGRIAYSGLFANTASRASMQAALNSMASNALNNETRSETSFTASGLAVYYTNSAFPTGSLTVLSVNYYDSYPAGSPAVPGLILQQGTLPEAPVSITSNGYTTSRSTKTLPTASYTRNIEDASWSSSLIWYDRLARPIGTLGKNHLGGSTRTETELDFAGTVKRSHIYHARKADEPGVVIRERFVHDNMNRLLQHYHQVDGRPEVLLAENTYNDLGQLTNKKVGNNLQSIDYAYNIRGWLTGLNKDQMALPDLGGRLFSYHLKYTGREGIANPDPVQFPGKNVVPRYNGSIAEADWRAVEKAGVNPPLTPKRYGYAYDGLNRLTAGYYQNPANPYSKENTESASYDLNGNITGMYRTSVTEYGSGTATVIDNLNYDYAGNRVNAIRDASQNPTGYEGGGNSIGYDLNGNMTAIPDKGISSIQYNPLNLPAAIELSRNGNETVSVKNLYRADGARLRKETVTTMAGISGSSVSKKTTDYLDGFQYLAADRPGTGGGGSEMLTASSFSARAMQPQAFSPELTAPGALQTKTPDLQFFPTAEGFYDYQKDQYIYSYTDHLGNVRVSYGRNSAGALEITDANDYYPFGMNHLKSGNAYFAQGSYKSYKFGGKELQETGLYDFGARFYMADIARWGAVDPLAEMMRRHSPYNYAFNNPVNFTDPDGMAPLHQFAMANENSPLDYQAPTGYNPNWLGLGDTDLANSYGFGSVSAGGGGGGNGYTFTGNAAASMFNYFANGGSVSGLSFNKGFAMWSTLDDSSNSMYNDYDRMLTGLTGGVTLHRAKVDNTSWDAYKNWADYGSGTIGTMYQTIADQRTKLYNSGYWVDNLGRRRLVNTFASPLRGSSANYLRTTTMFGKYAKRAGYIGYGLSAIEIGHGLYEDKGRFGKNTAVATAEVTTGIVVGGAVGAGATWLTGALAGAAGGSVAPGVGTVIGFVVGGVAGYFASDYVGGLVENSYK